MKSKKLIVGNWKMHTNVAEASLLFHRIDQRIQSNDKTEIILCPPSISLQTLRLELDKQKQSKKFGLGIQNIYDVDEGAFTGEISAEMVKDLVDYAIVGHSQRRIHFGERDKKIAQKVASCLRHGIGPILCVGENASERADGHAKRVISDQLSVDLSEVTSGEMSEIVIAYEPVWAIGTGKFDKPSDVDEIIHHIHRCLKELYSESVSSKVRVLYGGSVDPDDCTAYLKIDGVDGLLVGGASINYAKFTKIIELANKI